MAQAFLDKFTVIQPDKYISDFMKLGCSQNFAIGILLENQLNQFHVLQISL
jgi:hypothetical protein